MKQQAITSLPLSPEAERRNRMIKYSIAMGIRVVCIVLMLFVQGWWLVVCAIGAIALPYFAVVIANVHADPRGTQVVRPGGVQVYQPEPFFPSENPGGTPGEPGGTTSADSPNGRSEAEHPHFDQPDSGQPDSGQPDSDQQRDAS
jgi:hypothetical protein